MRNRILLGLIIFAIGFSACRRTNSEFVTVALSEPFTTFDTLTTEKNDAAAERMRNLIFNSLVKKAENFDYILLNDDLEKACAEARKVVEQFLTLSCA